MLSSLFWNTVISKFVGHQVGICRYIYEAECGCAMIQATNHCPVTAEVQA